MRINSKQSRHSVPPSGDNSEGTGTPVAPGTPVVSLGPNQAPPIPGCPAAPAGYEKDAKVIEGKLKNFTEHQWVELSMAGNQIANSTSYESDFGGFAPPQATMVEGLTRLAAWDDEVSRTERWLEYARDQRALQADDFIRNHFGGCKQAFTLAVSRNSKLASQYQALANIINARKEVGQRSAETKKKNKKAKAEAEKKAQEKK